MAGFWSEPLRRKRHSAKVEKNVGIHWIRAKL